MKWYSVNSHYENLCYLLSVGFVCPLVTLNFLNIDIRKSKFKIFGIPSLFPGFGDLTYLFEKTKKEIRRKCGLKIPKEFLISEAISLNRSQLDLYLSYGARFCSDRELGVSSIDRRKNGLRTISISLVGGDIS